MKMKSKGIFGKLIDITDKNDTDINISFVSHRDAQLDIIKKESKSSDIKDEDNKELTLLLADIKSHFKQNSVPLNITEGNSGKNKTIITGQKPDKASLSEAEIALQKMQVQAQKLGAELQLTARPDIMAEERWVLPEISRQEGRSADIPAGEGLAKLAAAIKTVTDTCPLQIELMIQPELRPQVMMKVSAGEINWIFAAKEGRYPVKDLLAKMAGKTTTNGWDAIVVYQRGQANTLLKQQHIKRFITGNMLAPVNEDIDSSTATRLLTHNLTLSAPHLFFNKPGSMGSTAQVAMDFIKGMIVYKEKAAGDNYRIMRIEKITPLNSPFVAMDVPLSKAPGSVSDVGEVQFDIREGTHFTNNLVVNGMEQETISNFFKQRFDATPENQRIYKLGTISNYEHEQFQPEKFDIRTMGAPNTASRGSQDEGDGAVVLFVQMKGSDARPVEKETDWLLADGYTSAMVVSNNQVLDNIQFRDDDFPVTFKKNRMGNDAASLSGLEAVTGKYSNKISDGGSFSFVYAFSFEVNVSFNFFDSGNEIYKLSPDYMNSGDESEMVSKFSISLSQVDFEISAMANLEETYYETFKGSVDMNLTINIPYKANIDLNKGNNISLINSDRDIDDMIHVGFYNLNVNHDVDINYNERYLPDYDNGKLNEFYIYIQKMISKILNGKMGGGMKTELFNYFNQYNLPLVNTFVLGNLLFPGENHFHSEFACIPGDLLVQGQLTPGSESFAITPTEITIVAGSVYQFTTTPEVSGAKWSISDSEKGNTGADLGTIDAVTGKYTAPQAKAITEGVRHVVVCAEKGDTKVYALASVVAKGVSVSPAYQVVLPGDEVTLIANSVNGGELKWEMGENKQDSSLKDGTNNKCTYKAGKKAAKLNLNLERVTVTDEKGASGEALILIPNSSMSGKITVSYDNVPADSVKLIYTVVVMQPALDENGDQIYDEDDNPVFGEKEVTLTGSQANWTAVETGGATFDKKTGILTSASGVGDGFAVIRVAYTEGSNQFRSAIVIPLPLRTYQKTILEAYSPER